MTVPQPATTPARADQIVIRRAGRSDVHGIGELWERAGLPPSTRGFRNEIARLRRRDPELLLIALIDGRLAGAIAGSYDGRTAVVSRLAVEPDLRRRGIAARLVAALCAQLADLGAASDALIVLDESESAEQFWTAIGFRRGDTASYFVRRQT